MSVVSLSLWMKALYFLRMFEWSGFLIRMIFLCIYDVRVFLSIFVGSILAFANSFYLLGRKVASNAGSSSETATERLLDDADSTCTCPAAAVEESTTDKTMFASFYQACIYTYKASMGDWDTDAFADGISPALLWFFWIMVTFCAMIVLLNILIAIVSETFGQVMSTSSENSYKEKAIIIRDI